MNIRAAILAITAAASLPILTVVGMAHADPPPEAGRVVSMKVAPQEVDCVGVAPMRCLNVQIGSNNRWEPLYQGITDFSYSPGYTYELEVREVHIANPPADASSIEYQLIKINSKTPA